MPQQPQTTPGGPEIVILDDDGVTEHVFPPGFDPAKAAGIVKSRMGAAPAAPAGPSSTISAPPGRGAGPAAPIGQLATGRATNAGPGGGGNPLADPTIAGPNFLGEMAAQFDPRTPTGRVNLASTAGSAALTRATGGLAGVPGVLPWVSRVLGPPIGAAFGGALETAIEQTAGTTSNMDPNAVTSAGLTQGAYELGGQAFIWPFRRVAKAFAAATVGQHARTALNELGSALRAGRQVSADATRAATEAGIRATRSRTAAQLAKDELTNHEVLGEITKQYDTLLTRPPSTLAAGVTARQAIEGPVKRALDLAGQRVTTAAESGPAIDFTPVIDTLRSLTKRAKPEAIFKPPDDAASPIGFLQNIAARRAEGAAATAGRATPIESARLAAIIQEQLKLSPAERLPLSGILDLVAQGPEELAFRDAHALKLLLDERVTWDKPAKAINERLTKATRIALRNAMSVHEPYNAATDAYHAIIPLYRRGVGREIITAAANNPDKVARMLNAAEPARAAALKDLLVQQSAAGATNAQDAEIGQHAWDAVRSSFTYNKVIKGGIEGLSQRVHNLAESNTEFAKIVYSDPGSQRVLSNLDTIGQAYQQALSRSKAVTTATKAGGKLDVADLQQQGLDALRATNRAHASARQSVEHAQQRLKDSSVGKFVTGTQELEGADIIRAAALGPGSIFGSLSIFRLLTRTASASDLVEWAAYSDRNTQRLVSALLNPTPDAATATFIRDAMSAINPPLPSHEPAVSAK